MTSGIRIKKSWKIFLLKGTRIQKKYGGCSLGVNLGAEIDGKNENFERPIIVMKVYNKETLVILPLTTKQKDDKFHHKIQTVEKTVWVKLTQMRVISNKRLLRKVDVLNEKSFDVLKDIWKQSL